MVRDIQNPAQLRAGGFTHTFVIGAIAKDGGSDHLTAPAGIGDQNFVLLKLYPGDVVKRAVLLDLIHPYVGIGNAATSVTLLSSVDGVTGAGGTLISTLADIRQQYPTTGIAAAGIDYVSSTANPWYIGLRFTGVAGSTLALATRGLVGVSLQVLRRSDRFPQT